MGGFPTIKHGNPDSLEAYDGARDFEDLQIFAKHYLEPTCGISRVDLCDDDTADKIVHFMTMPLVELASEVKEKEAGLARIEYEHNELRSRVQMQYEEGYKEKAQKRFAII